jgi:hypothetical protein
MGALEEGGKAIGTVVESMKGAPLAIALLIVNIGFLGFAAYLLGEVASNAKERNSAQLDMIKQLVTDIRDCRQPREGNPRAYDPSTKSMLFRAMKDVAP